MSNRPLQQNAEYYVGVVKEKSSQMGQDRVQIEKLRDETIKDTLQEVEAIRARKLLDEVKRGIQSPSTSVIAQVFAGKSSEEIATLLENMTPEAQQNLASLAARFDQNVATVPVSQAPPKNDFENAIAVIRLMKEMQPAPTPPPPQKDPMETALAIVKLIKETGGTPQKDPMEIIKTVSELQRPFYESLGKKDKELMDIKLKELAENKPPDLLDQLKYVKEASKELGLSSGQTNELDLRLEEMRQGREVDMKRLDWEQKKYELESDADVAKWEQITKILEGPVGRALQNMGSAGADRVRGGRGNPAQPPPRAVQTECPNCRKVIFVDADAMTAVCGNCGAQLQKAPEAPAPPPPSPSPAHVERPAPATTQVEEEEDGPDEEGEEEGQPEPEQ